tara:strand:+ start:478 stop:894 length:417 start_codon:yes stop_codon:yes gene_type:complete
MLVTKMNKITNRIAIAGLLLISLLTASSAGEWNTKPVICADQLETFGSMASQDQVLIAIGKQLTKVKDPDEQNGIAVNPVVLPWAIYGNLETGTFTVLEYHAQPYDKFCTIGFGVEFELVPQVLEDAIEWQRKRNGMN